jgi:hypothetical protein
MNTMIAGIIQGNLANPVRGKEKDYSLPPPKLPIFHPIEDSIETAVLLILKSKIH